MTVPSGRAIEAGTALAPSGPEFTAPIAACSAGCCAAGAPAAELLNASRALANAALLLTLCETSAAARLSAIAPMMAGPRVNPKSRSRLVDPLAMPAR